MDITERIILESGVLFMKYGIRGMTMDTLSEEMRISKRTIYEHFKDKDTLLIEVITHFKKQQAEEAHRIINESSNAIEAIFRIMRRSIAIMKQLNPSFFHDLQRYHSRTYNSISAHSDIRDFSVTLNILQTGVKQKVFRSDINIEIVNRTLHELFNLFGTESPLTRADFHRKELWDNIIIPYFRGISTAKGVEQIDKCNEILE